MSSNSRPGVTTGELDGVGCTLRRCSSSARRRYLSSASIGSSSSASEEGASTGAPIIVVLLLALSDDVVLGDWGRAHTTSSLPKLSTSLALNTFPLVLSLPLLSLPLCFSLSLSFPSLSRSTLPPPASTATPPSTASIPLGPIEDATTRPLSGLKLPIGLLPKDPPRSQEDDDEVRVLERPRDWGWLFAPEEYEDWASSCRPRIGGDRRSDEEEVRGTTSDLVFVIHEPGAEGNDADELRLRPIDGYPVTSAGDTVFVGGETSIAGDGVRLWLRLRLLDWRSSPTAGTALAPPRANVRLLSNPRSRFSRDVRSL